MASVTFPPAVGGDGSTVSDDSNSLTGLGNGGHRSRFVAALVQMVAVAEQVVAKAQAAAASAQSALNAPGTTAASTTSLAVGTGSKSLTIQTGKALAVGGSVIIASTASPANRMGGVITAYNAGTGALTVNVVVAEGSGTFAAWTVSLGVMLLMNNAALTGAPTAPTAAPGTNTTQLANTSFVQSAIAALVASSPAALDTLNELAAALGNDANFATTMTTALAGKQPLDGTLTALAALTTAANQLIYSTGADTFAMAALTPFARTLLDDVDAAAARATLAAAPLANAALTGTPSAPTAAPGTNNTQLANTAFVQTAIAALVASSPAALDTLSELAAALGNDPDFATTMVNALAGKQAAMDAASKAEMEAGTETALRSMSPVRIKEAIAALAPPPNILVTTRTANTQLTAADALKFIEITSGTFTQTFAAAAALGNGWWCYIRNAGSGVITLDPNGAEQIDGLTSGIIAPGRTYLVMCTGTAFVTRMFGYVARITEEKTSSGSWVCPLGIYEINVAAIGGGAGNASATGKSGNIEIGVVPVTPGSVYSYTVGAGGNWNPPAAGGDSTFTAGGVTVTGVGGKPSFGNSGVVSGDIGIFAGVTLLGTGTTIYGAGKQGQNGAAGAVGISY